MRDDSAHVERQVLQQLIVTLLREKVNDAVHGLVCVIGMQSGQTEVASLGKCKGVLHGFLMPNLSNENDIWRLPQGVGKGVIEGQGIGSYFALVHDASFVPVSELHGVFYGDDVTVGVFISVID